MSNALVAIAKALLRPLVRSFRTMKENRNEQKEIRSVARWMDKQWARDAHFRLALAALQKKDFHRALEITSAAERESGSMPWGRYVAGEVDAVLLPALRRTALEERFLLIKDWSCGFWADVDHVLGQLLIAEWTARTPVVYWGSSSLYHPGTGGNCFPLFFLPVGSARLEALTAPGLTYYPPFFHADNLPDHRDDQFTREGSLDKGFSILGREEAVLVSDRHVGIEVLWEYWSTHSLRPVEPVSTVVRRLFQQYLIPSDRVTQRVDAFWKTIPRDVRVAAAHVRGGDRTESFEKLDENNFLYFERLDGFLADDPSGKVFLLTDSSYVVERFMERYGNRVCFTNSQRSSNKTGVHYDPATDKAELGYETLVDVLIALRCDLFLGCMSNVSRFVNLLKDWNGASSLFANVPSNIL